MSNKTIESTPVRPWYSKSGCSLLCFIFLALIDLFGFFQGIQQSNLYDEKYMDGTGIFWSIIITGVLISGFIVAFELSTIYMAYAFSLKLYHYDRQALKIAKSKNTNTRLSKFISTTSLGWISFSAFILGVIANINLRLGIMEGKELINPETGRLSFDGAITIVMILLPIITSILNFVIGCFTFDPILFEIKKTSAKIEKYTIEKKHIESEIEVLEQQIKEIDQLKAAQENVAISKLIYAMSLKPALQTRIYEELIKSA